MLKPTLALAAAGLLLAPDGVVLAASKARTLAVSSTATASCIVSATNLNFGTYNGTAARASNSSVRVRCSNGSPYTVALSRGSGTFAIRTMKRGANALQYNLYTTSALSTIWGDGTSGTGTRTGTGTGLSAARNRTLTVFGSMPNNAANQDAAVGAYTDAITVTVAY
jgi:spore coat protein U-like protein